MDSNRGKYQERARETLREAHLAVLKHYSHGTMCCALCSENHVEFLALDHIKGGGRVHRLTRGGPRQYWENFIDQRFPKGYRVLCHNCNFKHGYRSKPVGDTKYSKHHQKIKSECITNYGGKCACCGVDNLDVLSIDHLNGGGTAHARELKSQGKRFGYSWLKSQGYPGGYQVLCHNCNQAKGANSQCPHEHEKHQRVVCEAWSFGVAWKAA